MHTSRRHVGGILDVNKYRVKKIKRIIRAFLRQGYWQAVEFELRKNPSSTFRKRSTSPHSDTLLQHRIPPTWRREPLMAE